MPDLTPKPTNTYHRRYHRPPKEPADVAFRNGGVAAMGPPVISGGQPPQDAPVRSAALHEAIGRAGWRFRLGIDQDIPDQYHDLRSLALFPYDVVGRHTETPELPR